MYKSKCSFVKPRLSIVVVAFCRSSTVAIGRKVMIIIARGRYALFISWYNIEESSSLRLNSSYPSSIKQVLSPWDSSIFKMNSSDWLW